VAKAKYIEIKDDDPSWWDDEHILMAIDLGFDEGGSGDKLMVSVQVGITEPAKRLKKQWKSRLLLANDLEFFHSKDFGNYTGGVFTKAELERPARVELLRDLCGLMHCHLIAGISARTNISEYDANTTPAFRSKYGTAYAFLIDMCLIGAYSLVKDRDLKPHFNILIEKGHRNSEQVAQILERLQAMPAEIAASLSPGDVIPDIKILTAGLGDKKDNPILQAADMVAYSDWQGFRGGDPTIWNAIHRPGIRYRTHRVWCGKKAIHTFVTAGPKKFWPEFMKGLNADDQEQ
jgi:hypothetical protein